MGLILQQALGAGAPEVEDGITEAIFAGVTPESHPDWAGPNKFGGQDDGERWRFAFTPLNAQGEVIYQDGDAVEVDILTNQTMGKKANAYQIMSALLTKAEKALIDANQPVDADSIVGRPCQIVIEHNDKGWPKVASVMPARKGQVAPKIEAAPAAVAPAAEEAGEDDEEAQLAAQLAAAKARKAAAAVPVGAAAGPTKAEQAALDAKAERVAAAKAALASALEAEEE